MSGNIVKYLPFNVAPPAVATGAATGFGGAAVAALPANTALLLVGVWLVGALLVTAVAAERAKITG